MEALAKLTDAASLRAALAPIVDLYGVWIAAQATIAVAGDARAATQKELLRRAGRAKQRILAGIELLEKDDVREAFCLMNQAMADAALARSGHRYDEHKRPSWRMFQLAFVLLGPESKASVAGDTALVVRDLFRGARTSVIVGGYAFDEAEILMPLHEAMRDRGVSATLFLNVEGEAGDVAEAEALVTRTIDAFFRDVWTCGRPRPAVYCDPRTALRGPPWASMHAKCIVVDDERALVTSANFTRRGQSRNIEAGVLIEDRAFAEELAPANTRCPPAPIRRETCGTTKWRVRSSPDVLLRLPPDFAGDDAR